MMLSFQKEAGLLVAAGVPLVFGDKRRDDSVCPKWADYQWGKDPLE